MIAGRCHCGSTAFEIDGEIPAALTRCTCSFCAKRGALYAYYAPEQFRLGRQDSASVYRWGSKHIAHYFCGVCGCATHSDSPAFQPDGKWDGTTRIVAVNARLFDGFVADDAPVTTIDGRNLW